MKPSRRAERPEMSQVDAILDRASELVAIGWSPRGFSVDGDANPVAFDNGGAVAFSSADAVQRAALRVCGDDYERDWLVAIHFTEEAMRHRGWTTQSVPVWSEIDNMPGRSGNDVAGLFQEAKRLAEFHQYRIPTTSRLFLRWTQLGGS